MNCLRTPATITTENYLSYNNGYENILTLAI